MDYDEEKYIEEIEHQQLVCDVNNEITLYQNTGDGRYFWRAFLTLHDAGAPIPPDFIAKFAALGNRLLRAATPGAISVALEFSNDDKNHVGPKHSRAYERRWRVASEVQAVQRLRPGLKLVEAKKIVARNSGLSFAAVSKAYHGVFTAPVKKSETEVQKKTSQSIDAAMKNWLR